MVGLLSTSLQVGTKSLSINLGSKHFEFRKKLCGLGIRMPPAKAIHGGGAIGPQATTWARDWITGVVSGSSPIETRGESWMSPSKEAGN